MKVYTGFAGMGITLVHWQRADPISGKVSPLKVRPTDAEA
jgi:hypothetical protein